MVVIDDDRLLCDTVRHGLNGIGVQVLTAHSGAEGLRLCAERPVDVVLLDQKLPDGDGIAFCGPLLERKESAKIIIFITAYPSFENAVQAIKVGAYDYLSKPFELGELSLAVRQALRTLDLEHVAQVQHYQGKRESDRSVLVGELQEVRHLVALAASNAAPVLITGETGTGKTLVAKAIHFQGQGADQAFIAVNCAAIPENLMEAELFGYEKGAFTGAVATVKGLFEMADGGTLFLDEIGEMPTHLQSKLLGALDDQHIRRLGGRTLNPVHARIITATNTDLAAAVRERRFREDLYYRLGVMHIPVPPLRARLDDLPELCRCFSSQIARDQEIRLEADEIAALRVYPWPGNVRELRNIIERAILVRTSATIRPSCLLGSALQAAPPPDNPGKAAAVPRPLEAMEREHIHATLRHFNGNQTHAAKALGISRSTLVRKLKTLGLPG
ncbi:MAG: sigma-54-dependent Fis family transcriptional regulator [Desulfobacterales bacterium]|nr:sigma-54-dependent Fis family transcriptional regulator [Desulfobacterales bacterium]